MNDLDVQIRPLQIEDAHISYKWRNKKLIWEKTINSPDREITLKDELNWLNEKIKENNSKRFAILVSGKYVGNVQLTNILENESYFGIFIGEEKYWGKGVGKIATSLILKIAFNKLSLKKVKLRVKENNKRAINVYTKLGFQIVSKSEDIIFMEVTKYSFIPCI